jgi:hypothetical protein
MKSVSLESLIKSIKLSIVKSTDILEKSHIQKISEYFNDDGTPICRTLNLNGKETQVPLYTLVNHQTLALDELEMSFKAKIYDSDEEKNTEEKYGLVHQIKKNPLNPFIHKDIQVDMRKTKEDAAGFAEVKLKFKITDKPEEVCRIEDQLIQNINPK